MCLHHKTKFCSGVAICSLSQDDVNPLIQRRKDVWGQQQPGCKMSPTLHASRFQITVVPHLHPKRLCAVYLSSWRLDWWAPAGCWPPAPRSLRGCQSPTCRGLRTAPAGRAAIRPTPEGGKRQKLMDSDFREGSAQSREACELFRHGNEWTKNY